MRTKYFEKDGKHFLAVTVPDNLFYGFVSSTGKSFVFRVKGSYLKGNGAISGDENTYSDYINKRLPHPVSVITHRSYGPNDIVKVDFDDVLFSAILIQIMPFKSLV